MYRLNTYNEGYFYTLLPLASQPVVPGQSVAIAVEAAMETPAFQTNIMNGGVAHIYAFYTPFRLVWDEWMNWISDPESTAVFPMTEVNAPALFETGIITPGISALPRRAYKLIYNQYFGSDQYGGGTDYWYDVNNDSDVSQRRIRTLNQMLGKLMGQSQAPEDTYEAPVTGTAPNQIASIGLNDFRQRMKEARSDRRSDLTGDKYVDAMRRMGVQLDWKIQMAPEFLGQMVHEFSAKETRASYTPADPAPAGSAVTGRAYARYSESFKFSTQRKFFAEHGIIWVLAAIRPQAFKKASGFPIDRIAVSRSSMFLGDNQTGVTTMNRDWFGLPIGGDPLYGSRFEYLLSGGNFVGQYTGTPWVTTDDTAATFDALLFPEIDIPQDAAKTTDYVMCTRYKGMGPTPVRRNVF